MVDEYTVFSLQTHDSIENLKARYFHQTRFANIRLALQPNRIHSNS